MSRGTRQTWPPTSRMQVGLTRALVSVAPIVLFRTRARSSPSRSSNRVPAPPPCVSVGPAHPRRTTHRGVIRCTSMCVYVCMTVQLHPHSTAIYYHTHKHDITYVRYVPLATSGVVQANSVSVIHAYTAPWGFTRLCNARTLVLVV